MTFQEHIKNLTMGCWEKCVSCARSFHTPEGEKKCPQCRWDTSRIE